MRKEEAKIAYLHIQFPKLSETFVWREIEALDGLGIDIQNYSLKRPFPGEINDATRRFAESTIYQPHFFSFGMLKSHLSWLFRRPRAYLSALRHIFTSHYPPSNWWLAWRKPLIFWRAAHLAGIIDNDKNIVHLHAHFKYVALIAWIVSRLTGLNYSFTSHFATNALMVGKIAADADFVAAVSEREKNIIKKEMPPGAQTPIHLIRLGLPEEYFAPIDEEKKSQTPTIISMGRLIPKKGFVFLLRALAELKNRNVIFKAEIVGDGPLRKYLESQAAELDLAQHLTFAGALNPSYVRDALDKSCVFALFCTYGPDGDVDGLPVAMMEAMARGLPVVTTRISSLAELVDDGESGFLAPPGHISAFADALQKLIENPEMRRQMGSKARAKVEREYKLAREASEMKNLFETILKNRGHIRSINGSR